MSFPLVVDLDGTLIKTDLLLENFYVEIKQNPRSFFLIPGWLAKGRAFLKETLASRAQLNVQTLPYNNSFLFFLREQYAQGRPLILATASHISFAQNIADYLGIFQEVLASSGQVNLKGKRKLKVLLEKFGEKNFDYAGNDAADLHIFPHARRSILVNPDSSTLRRARKTAEVEQVFTDPQNCSLFKLFKAMRVYQWVKNILLLIPLLTSHEWNEIGNFWALTLGFVSFGFCASGGYIFNDLLDLWADRGHPRKKNRPFASGEISILEGTILMGLLQTLGLTLAALVNTPFFFTVLIYSVISLSYTFLFKTYALIDVLILASLYTIRVIAGALLIDVPLSFWLLAFCVFIFFSLALVKRCSELISLSRNRTDFEKTIGRDYYVSDIAYLKDMGIASGYLAILIVAFYINSSNVMTLYARPTVLWLLCPVLFYWISRLWLKTGRGEMHDDPIIFSVRDRGSRVAVAMMAVIILFAL